MGPRAAPLAPRPGIRAARRRARRIDRPRHPERTALYRLFERHFDEYLRAHEERFERTSGPLRAIVPRTVEAYLDCGRMLGGFTRLAAIPGR